MKSRSNCILCLILRWEANDTFSGCSEEKIKWTGEKKKWWLISDERSMQLERSVAENQSERKRKQIPFFFAVVALFFVM